MGSGGWRWASGEGVPFHRHQLHVPMEQEKPPRGFRASQQQQREGLDPPLAVPADGLQASEHPHRSTVMLQSESQEHGGVRGQRWLPASGQVGTVH